LILGKGDDWRMANWLGKLGWLVIAASSRLIGQA
jgi:hypothetical protein